MPTNASNTLRYYALLSSQGTACAETTLREDDYTPHMRAIIEAHIDPLSSDPAIPGTWVDVSDNEACVESYASPVELM